jgi:hypothetical protein
VPVRDLARPSKMAGIVVRAVIRATPFAVGWADAIPVMESMSLEAMEARHAAR